MNFIYLTIIVSSLIINDCLIYSAPAQSMQFQQQSSQGSGSNSFQQQQSSSNGGSSSSSQQYSNGTHTIIVNQDLSFKVIRLISETATFQPNLSSMVSFGNGTHVLKIFGDGRTIIELTKQEPFVPFTFAPFNTFAPWQPFPTFAPFNFGK